MTPDRTTQAWQGLYDAIRDKAPDCAAAQARWLAGGGDGRGDRAKTDRRAATATLALVVFGTVLLVGAFALLLWTLTSAANAHQAAAGWTYDPACCSDKDCRAAMPGEAAWTVDGIAVAPVGGVHEVIDHDDWRVRESPDFGWHICLTSTGHVRCVYQPAAGA